MGKIAIDLKEGKIVKDSDLVVGIDLGTTNSLVAYIKDGKVEAVKGPDGKSTLVPSIVHFAADGSVIVGDAAKERLLMDPYNTIYSVKRLMGKSYRDVGSYQQYFGYKIIDEDTESLVKIRVKDKFYTPTELSAEILKELKRRIEKEIGDSVTKAVITVPAYFNDAQRQATRDAGKLAGLDVLRIVNEPTAASLAYGIGLHPSQIQKIAVYDLGGGTFDISILSIQDGIFEVLSTNGNTFLGGDDFDRAIIDYWLKTNSIDPVRLQSDKGWSQLMRLLAEKAKKQLSFQEEFIEQAEGFDWYITRLNFESLIKPFVEETLRCCENALRDAKLSASEIDQVVMVGGSTRVPMVKEKVSEFFGKPVFDNLNPDEVVALGAAIQADVLAGNQKDVLLLDITPLSLGIETVGGLMDVLLPRNSKIPSRVGRQYTTSVDGQTKLKIAVYQGERDLVTHNRKLGEFVLSGIPPMPAGLPRLEVQFLLNADGILTVKAKELRSDVEQAIDIKPTYGITEEEMAQMLLDSLQHAQEDMSTRGVLEAVNEANNILLSTDKFLQQNADWLSDFQKESITQLADAIKIAIGKKDKDLINKAMDDLNGFSSPLAHEALDRNIAKALKGSKVN